LRKTGQQETSENRPQKAAETGGSIYLYVDQRAHIFSYLSGLSSRLKRAFWCRLHVAKRGGRLPKKVATSTQKAGFSGASCLQTADGCRLHNLHTFSTSGQMLRLLIAQEIAEFAQSAPY